MIEYKNQNIQEFNDLCTGQVMRWKSFAFLKDIKSPKVLMAGTALASSVGQQQCIAVLKRFFNLVRKQNHNGETISSPTLTNGWSCSTDYVRLFRKYHTKLSSTRERSYHQHRDWVSSQANDARQLQQSPTKNYITTRAHASIVSRIAMIDFSAGPFSCSAKSGVHSVKKEKSLYSRLTKADHEISLQTPPKMVSHKKGYSSYTKEMCFVAPTARRLGKLRTIFDQLKCEDTRIGEIFDSMKRITISSTQLSTSSSHFRHRISCKRVASHMWLLNTFAAATPKLIRYYDEIKLRQRALSVGSNFHRLDIDALQRDFVDLLQQAEKKNVGYSMDQFLDDRSTSVEHVLSQNLPRAISNEEGLFLSNFGNMLASFTSSIIFPISVTGLGAGKSGISKPSFQISTMAGPYRYFTMGSNAPLEVAETKASAKNNWIDIFIVRFHDTYDTLDIDNGGS